MLDQKVQTRQRGKKAENLKASRSSLCDYEIWHTILTSRKRATGSKPIGVLARTSLIRENPPFESRSDARRQKVKFEFNSWLVWFTS